MKKQVVSQNTDATRVVWIRVGALGDLLVSLKALESSLTRFPRAKFWIVGSKLWTEILEPKMWPRIVGILICENGSGGSFFAPHDNQWRVESPFLPAAELYRQADASINLRIESYRFAWGPLRTLIPIRIGSCPPHSKWIYTHWYPWLGKEPKIHERDWYDSVARTNKDASIQDIKLGELEKTGLPPLTRGNSEKVQWLWGLENKSYVLVNPTASRREKAWSAENYLRLVSELSSRVQTIVVGSPTETEWLQTVAGQKARVIQPNSLMDLFDLVAAAKFIVCNTSSLQFVAAAQQTKAIVLMGLASPLRWGPLGPHDIAIEAPEKSTNEKINLFERERLAYASIPFDQVWRAVESSC